MRGSAVFVACTVVAACSSVPERRSGRIDPRYGVSASARVIPDGQPIPKGGGRDQVGKPYSIAGRVYVPREDPDYDRTGTASWYGADFHGRLTANGEIYDRMSLSAAHPTMPLPSYARVTNLRNGRSVIVRVNDRGPYHGNREIDLSERTAELLEFKGRGLADVRVQYVGRAPLEGSDDRFLAATLITGEPSIARDRVMIAEAGGRPPESERIRVASARPAGGGYDRDALGATIGSSLDDDETAAVPATPAARPASPGPGPVEQFRPGAPPYRLSYAEAPDAPAPAGHAAFAALGQGTDFARLADRSAGPGAGAARIDLGTYADAANAERLAERMAAFGTVDLQRRARADGRVLTAVKLVTDARSTAAALAAASAFGVRDARLVD